MLGWINQSCSLSFLSYISRRLGMMMLRRFLVAVRSAKRGNELRNSTANRNAEMRLTAGLLPPSLGKACPRVHSSGYTILHRPNTLLHALLLQHSQPQLTWSCVWCDARVTLHVICCCVAVLRKKKKKVLTVTSRGHDRVEGRGEAADWLPLLGSVLSRSV